MTLRILRSSLLFIVTLVLACGGGGDDGVEPADAGPQPVTGPIALFDPVVPGSGAEWGTLPFPSDMFIADHGGIELVTLPVGETPSPEGVVMLQEALRTVKGFGVGSQVYFPTNGAVSEATLAGNVKLIDLDGGNAEIPLDLIYRPDLRLIVAAPELGVGLDANHRFAAFVTTAVTDSSGDALRKSEDFEAVVDTSLPADDAITAARTQLQPLFDAGVVDPSELAVATVFTIEDVTTTTKKMRDVVAAAPPVIDSTDPLIRYGPDAGELDEIFGVQDPDAVAGHGHFMGRAQPHGTVATVIHGTFDLPSFLSDELGVDGVLELDSNGDPVLKGTQPARFTLVLPDPPDPGTGATYADTPVIFFVHGINRTRADLLALAEPAAQRGFAVIAIDLLHHGHRRVNWVDEKNDTTKETCTEPTGCPDGFADQAELLGSIGFFHLSPSGGLPAYHPLPMRENLRQSAIDLCSMAAFIDAGDLSAINSELFDAGLPNDLSFRGDEIAIVTESFGSMMSLVAMAIEPRFDIGFLASPASSFPFPTLVHSPNFSPTFLGVILGAYDALGRTVLDDPRTGARWEPIMTLWNTVMQTGDPVAFAPHILTGALRGDDGANLILAQTWADEWVPNDAVEHTVGVLGLPVMTVGRDMAPPGDLFRHVPSLTEVTGPIKANMNGGKRTAVHTLWYPAAHALVRKIREGHKFEPDFPPFVRRDTEWEFDSPVDKVQDMWGQFLTDFYNGDPAPAATNPWP